MSKAKALVVFKNNQGKLEDTKRFGKHVWSLGKLMFVSPTHLLELASRRESEKTYS